MRLEHRLTVAGSIALSAAGLCDMVGLFAGMSAAGWSPLLALLALMACVCVALVSGAEIVKARLLMLAHEAAGGWRTVARFGWAFFIALSISLSHAGLIATERAILAPVVSPLRAAVVEARAELDAVSDSIEARQVEASSRANRLAQEIAATPETYAREREALRDRRDAIEAELSAALAPLEQERLDAARNLSRAEAALAEAPAGFMALSVVLFGVRINLAAWLIPIAIEYITGLYGRLSAPVRREPRSIEHADALTLEPAGLELIGDVRLLRALQSKHASLAAKCGYVAKALEKPKEKLSAR